MTYLANHARCDAVALIVPTNSPNRRPDKAFTPHRQVVKPAQTPSQYPDPDRYTRRQTKLNVFAFHQIQQRGAERAPEQPSG